MQKKLEILPFINDSDTYSGDVNSRLLLYCCSYKNPEPAFVFDLERIRSNYKIIQQAFEGCNVHYALKANSEVRILKTLKDNGASFETASIGEVKRLLELKVSPKKIIFSNPCKSKEDIVNLANMGIRYFSFENTKDLDRLINLVPKGVFVLRLNLNEIDPIHINYGATWDYIKTKIIPNPRYASAIQGITYYGIHDIGLKSCEKLLSKNKLPNVKFINIGGAIQYDGLKEDLDAGYYNGGLIFFTEKLRILKEKFKIDIIVEPGTAVLYNACNAIGRIKYVNNLCTGTLNYHLDLGPTIGLRKPPSVAYVLRESSLEIIMSKANILDAACSQRIIGNIGSHERFHEGDRFIFPNVGMYSIMYICDFHLLQIPEILFLPLRNTAVNNN
ncbi:hypothetical protein GCM10011344_11690 [Dokdonia pacifica]|uniref:Diaminopimelate decarboxylase n=1 Tax=Dokdonia pacifica TaxID=1627892 RepID=A0A238YG76_9FLAO|nr:hypothetical protein [Dokdonia pacifica]GGG12632.1 hypothetical protein GCM10011344_11690 [Dokdonia pacifica]SNR69808.1 Diaminopimelate decarboxylase [Dokdonia pacifica]